MTKLERKLETLTIYYFSKHKGKNNKEQAAALAELNILQNSVNAIRSNKIELPDEIIDYMSLRRDKDLSDMHFKRLSKDGKIPQCTISPLEYYGETTIMAQRSYLYMEILEGKHNEFLQRIIDRSKEE